jgi:hypothetical protein
MKSFHHFVQAGGEKPGFAGSLRLWRAIFACQGEAAAPGRQGKKPWLRRFRDAFLPVVLLAVCLLGLGGAAQAQVVPSADRGGLTLSAGGTLSAYHLGYGEQKLLGPAIFVEADGRQHIGVEGEARWLKFHWKAGQNGPAADERATTYLIGPRYSMYYGRFQPYLKGLAGAGHFNFPYNLGRDNCLVIALGGGFDYRLTRRIRWRAVDFEYQSWPQFHYGQMSSYGASTGLRIKIF